MCFRLGHNSMNLIHLSHSFLLCNIGILNYILMNQRFDRRK